MNILMTGATGMIGKELGKALIKKGHNLIVITRNEEKALEELPFPCVVVEADLVQGPLAKEDPRLANVDIVVNLMGESVASGRWSEKRKRKIYESRVHGTRHLIESLNTQPKIFLSASAIGYYGDRGEEELDEDSSPGQDFLSQVCQDWEEELLSLAYADTLTATRVVAMRSGVVLSRRGGALDKMLPLFRHGLGGVIGDGTQWMSWIHIEDEVGLILHAIENSNVIGPLNMVSPQPVTNREFSETLAEALGKTLGPRVPKTALFLALGEMSAAILSSEKVVPKKALATGYKFKYPTLEEALEDVCGPYRDGEDFYFSEQYLPWKPEQVFPFFTEAKNLEKITPDLVNFHLEKISTPKITEGTAIDYKLRIHGIPSQWQSTINEWKPPYKFVDVQTKGPYDFWQHTHEFSPFGGGTLMVDKVRYRLPLGSVGEFVGGPIVRRDVEKIFGYRRKYLAKNLKQEIEGRR